MNLISRALSLFTGGSMSWLYVAAALAVFAAGWTVKGWQADAARAELVAEYNAATNQVVKDANDRRAKVAAAYARLDADHYRELQNAKQETNDLRAAVANGSRRLLVRAKCPASAQMPGAATSSGVGDGGAAELDAVAGSAYFTHREGVQHVTNQLKACQAILRSQLSSNP